MGLLTNRVINFFSLQVAVNERLQTSRVLHSVRRTFCRKEASTNWLFLLIQKRFKISKANQNRIKLLAQFSMNTGVARYL